MKSLLRNGLVLAVAGICIGLGGNVRAYAQESLTAEVPFKFIVGGKTHDAGKYEMRVMDGERAIEFKGPSKDGGFAEVMTRLAGTETHGIEGRLVFDKVGDNYYLSEMWLPDQEGFLVYAAKEKHTHHIIILHRHGRTS